MKFICVKNLSNYPQKVCGVTLNKDSCLDVCEYTEDKLPFIRALQASGLQVILRNVTEISRDVSEKSENEYVTNVEDFKIKEASNLDVTDDITEQENCIAKEVNNDEEIEESLDEETVVEETNVEEIVVEADTEEDKSDNWGSIIYGGENHLE